VRTGFEYQRGHLPDATNINYYSFTFKDQLDKLDKNVTWLVHCRTGVRSGKTLPIMKSLGFESIVHLDGGIVTWTDDGLPLVR
jgi:rhodanese-related sulfurtransferase